MIKAFFAIFFLYNFSFAACPISYSYGNFEGPLSFSTYGNYGFLGDLNILKIYNLSNPVSPSYISSIDLENNIYNIYTFENYVYCGVKDKGLYVVDITNISKPKVVSSIAFKCTCSCPMTSFGNYAYLCSDGLYVLDISNKSKPNVIKHYANIPCGKPFVSGNYLYLSSGYILSISDPENPIILANSNECLGSDIFVEGNYSYFPGWYTMLIVCDISEKKILKKLAN